MNAPFREASEAMLLSTCMCSWHVYHAAWVRRRDWVYGCADLCESPIERKFLIPMLFWEKFRVKVVGASPWCSTYTDRFDDQPTVFIEPQARIGQLYRVDFLITPSRGEKNGTRLIVECDGHDYHERTKEQARKDRSRDRMLTKLGFLVFRYTGSEINENPRRCVEEIETVVWQELVHMLDDLPALPDIEF